MRLFMLPVLVATLFAADQPVEPSEHAMRAAFETRLALDVQNALAFVQETAGEAGVQRVRAAGTDQFAIRTFRKHDCVRGEIGHTCGFEVELAVVTGTIQQTLRGRFLSGPGGLLTFAHAS